MTADESNVHPAAMPHAWKPKRPTRICIGRIKRVAPSNMEGPTPKVCLDHS